MLFSVIALRRSVVLGVVQNGFKDRDPRVKVFLPSRIRVGSAWADACIHNVSARGLLVAADDVPKPGSYVEIRRGHNVIIGRAVWKKERFFGVRTQDRIDLPALQVEPTRSSGRSAANTPNSAMERRREDRFKKDAAMARKLERSLALSRVLQFGLIALAAVGASAVVATAVHSVLGVPFDLIQQAMAGGP
jgi:hypothetical protein